MKKTDASERLQFIRTLWERLGHLRPKSPEYNAVTEQIRKEADAFRKLVESQTQEDQEQE